MYRSEIVKAFKDKNYEELKNILNNRDFTELNKQKYLDKILTASQNHENDDIRELNSILVKVSYNEMLDAAENNNIEKLKKIIDSRTDMNLVGSSFIEIHDIEKPSGETKTLKKIKITPAAQLALENKMNAMEILLKHGANATYPMCALIQMGKIQEAMDLDKRYPEKEYKNSPHPYKRFDQTALTAAEYGHFDYAEELTLRHYELSTDNYKKSHFLDFAAFIQGKAKEKGALERVDKLRTIKGTLKKSSVAEGALSSGNILYYMFLSCIYGEEANSDDTLYQNTEPRETDLNMLIITLSILSEARYPLEGIIDNITSDKNLNLSSYDNQFLNEQAKSITSHYSNGNENKSEEKEENTENTTPYMFFSSFQEKYQERNPSMLFFDGVAFRMAMSSLKNIFSTEEDSFDSDSIESFKELSSIEDLITLIAKYLFLGGTVKDAHFSDNLKNAEEALTTGDAPKLVMKSS